MVFPIVSPSVFLEMGFVEMQLKLLKQTDFLGKVICRHNKCDMRTILSLLWNDYRYCLHALHVPNIKHP